jgi:hypothetical protein
MFMTEIFDFKSTPEDFQSQQRFVQIQTAHHYNPTKSKLAKLLLNHRIRAENGTYCPVSDTVKLPRKLPHDLLKKPFDLPKAELRTYFTNPMVLPADYESSSFNPYEAAKPRFRATNAGFVAVTIEHDCESVFDLDEVIGWTNKDDFLAAVDLRLKSYRDYRGYCAVYSGNKSVHFHFVFDTVHLTMVDHNASWAERLSSGGLSSAFMSKVHEIYWDLVAGFFREKKPDLKIDVSLRDYTHWRRMPWGTRVFDGDKKHLLGIPLGTRVQQIVLSERLNMVRAPKGSVKFAIPPDYKLAPSFHRTPKAMRTSGLPDDLEPKLLAAVVDECRAHWRVEYPRPTVIRREGVEWVFHFENGPNDKTPSSIVRGDHTRLLIQGRSELEDREFIMPGELSANETAEYWLRKFGIVTETSFEPRVANDYSFAGMRIGSPPCRSAFDVIAGNLIRSFPIDISTETSAELKQQYRTKLRKILFATVPIHDTLAVSGEGIGKTTGLFQMIAWEALDRAANSVSKMQRFSCFAFRTGEQAEAKAEEFARLVPGFRSVVLQSFWKYYEQSCAEFNCDPIIKDDFESHEIDVVLEHIMSEQRQVYDALEERRQAIWSMLENNQKKFSAGTTVLFVTHAFAKTFSGSRLTRTWLNPQFNPIDLDQSRETIRAQWTIVRTIFDDPEQGDFYILLSDRAFQHLQAVSSENENWRNLSREVRRQEFRKHASLFPDGTSLETYESFRRLTLSSFVRVGVDFDFAQFGRDNKEDGIYRKLHGNRFYIGPQDWFRPYEWTFLTTERLVANTIQTAYRRIGKNLLYLILDDLPGIYPLHLPVVFDPRASSRDAAALANEIIAQNSKATVIGNGIRAVPKNAMTFQRAKGDNSLTEQDIYVILTFVSPEQFVELNVLGQWINEPEVIALHYAGLINQSVGRNTGFRQKEGTQTAVVISQGLFRMLAPGWEKVNHRVRLHPTRDPFW